MILLTGAAGFIGGRMLSHLNGKGRVDVLIVDDFGRADRLRNWQGKEYALKVEREALFDFMNREKPAISTIIHLGARTDTTHHHWETFLELNLSYSQTLWDYAVREGIPFLYASSAATYGDGGLGFVDDHAVIPELQPLNLYGKSKQDFDLWALAQSRRPPKYYGFKFFNVYGYGESHKGRMASVVFHTFGQIRRTGGMKLFRSHRPGVADGQQSRDFIHVGDVVETLFHFMGGAPESGIYNLGTGKARPFMDLALGVFGSMGLPPDISFIDTPLDIRDKYQYFTRADVRKLRKAGVDTEGFLSLETGIDEYIKTLNGI